MGSEMSLSRADSALGSALTGLAVRQRAIANNVANVDTPGFKRGEVQFERQLQSALTRRQSVSLVATDPRHFADVRDDGLAVAPELISTADSTLRNDGNNVDIDQEMIKLADTSIRYNAVSQLVAGRFSLLRSIINEGRR